jgi:alkylation response protein AidB-like acyl-CoA dehydrogenase
MPYALNVPTFGILAATLIDCGTHEQKARHLPAILKGDELWVQFLSEPSGGSDLAGCLTRADRDGDVFVLNGSKIWSSGAAEADYAMILARTNWDVPKHRGLTMFILKIHQPGVTVERIKQVDGTMEFCQEFFDDVHIPEADIVGNLDDGWNVASQLLVHERLAVGGGSPYLSGRWGEGDGDAGEGHVTTLAKELGKAGDPVVRQLVAEAHVRTLVHGALNERLATGSRVGAVPAAFGSIVKLFGATNTMRRVEIGLEIAGPAAIAWSEPDTIEEGTGVYSLLRQGGSLGGGSNEIQRNIISERVLGMPREAAADREIPYRDVKRTGGK